MNKLDQIKEVIRDHITTFNSFIGDDGKVHFSDCAEAILRWHKADLRNRKERLERAPKPLTDIQRTVLSMIETYIETDGYSPTMTEISDRLGVSISTVQGHIRSLKSKGYITQRRNVARGLRIKKKGNQ